MASKSKYISVGDVDSYLVADSNSDLSDSSSALCCALVQSLIENFKPSSCNTFFLINTHKTSIQGNNPHIFP